MREVLKDAIIKSWDDGVRDGRTIIINSLEQVLREHENSDIMMSLSDFIEVVKNLEFPNDSTELYDKKFK